jgi:ABC-type Zn uptake system ZnuABC Zn-binding protein ZnuA
MKYIILLSVLLTGCATTNDYNINGQTEPLKILGTIVLVGVIAKGIAKPGSNVCATTIKNNIGQTVGTATTVKQGPC